jgi:hypothetical protein
MKEYKGNIENVSVSDKYVFDFLSDFKHFDNFLPEQISEWETGDDYCKFSIASLGSIKLVYSEKIPNSKIVIQPASDSGFPIPFYIKSNINKIDDNNSTFQFIVEADVNPMIATMVNGPLNQFVQIITVKLRDYLNSAI